MKGVKGIGKATASQILTVTGPITNYFENPGAYIEKLSESRIAKTSITNLKNAESQIHRNLNLTRLRKDVEVPPIETIKFAGIDTEKAKKKNLPNFAFVRTLFYFIFYFIFFDSTVS